MLKLHTTGSKVAGRQAAALMAVLSLLTMCAGTVHATEPQAAPSSVELRLPPDIVFSRGIRADSAVVFSHATHVEYESRRCTGCHIKLFRILNTTHATSHRDMNAGASCGACHDGKHAFDVRATESCGSCHGGRKAAPAATAGGAAGKSPAAFAGPGPFAFKQGGESPGRVTFRHATHLGKAMTCRTCHPKPFAMHGTAPLPDGGMHTPGACGMCHDGKKSFSVEDDSKCVRCHAEGSGK